MTPDAMALIDLLFLSPCLDSNTFFECVISRGGRKVSPSPETPGGWSLMAFLLFPGLCGLYLEKTAQVQVRRGPPVPGSFTLGENAGLTPGLEV
jgi:hypothetical protein